MYGWIELICYHITGANKNRSSAFKLGNQVNTALLGVCFPRAAAVASALYSGAHRLSPLFVPDHVAVSGDAKSNDPSRLLAHQCLVSNEGLRHGGLWQSFGDLRHCSLAPGPGELKSPVWKRDARMA